MARVHGFELLRERTIPEIGSHARLFRHRQSGAELLVLSNDDENKTFCATFRTLPRDHTGVAHILEHCVLAGSRKYPVKDPFSELIKGSLATYINASTSPDSTDYPVASQNLQDFYNLMEVYLDAVFHPRLLRQAFEQEGWHYDLPSPEGPLSYVGIVFNEMKGLYADPDWVQTVAGMGALMPDTVYGLDIGGQPRHIPELTYEQFRAFHAAYYHPSNARLFLYGDMPLEETLRRIDACLQEFDQAPPGPPVALQAPFPAPRALTVPYPASAGEEGPKAYLTVSWLLRENDDPVEALALGILDYILLGSPAAPLRKALVDSGLGEDITAVGSWPARQISFSAGLKGVALDDAERVEPLILQTLQMLAEEGIDPATVEAALNTVEFHLRENNAPGGQRGLALHERAMVAWLHGRDPLERLAFEAPLSTVQARWRADPAYFSALIRRYLLDNPHRVTLLLTPDPALQQREEQEERERLARKLAELSPAEAQQLVENTQALRAYQETPNSPEALATLPFLKRSDLDPQIKRIPLEEDITAGCRLLYHPLPTNGIVYLDLGLDLHLLPQEELPYATILGRALLEMGTEAMDYVKLTQWIGRATGGIFPDVLTAAARGGRPDPVWLLLRGKAMADKAPELLAILREVLLTARLDDRERLRQIVLEEKARREAALVPAGAGIVSKRLRAHFSEAAWAGEQLTALSSLFFLRRLAQELESDWPAVESRLESVRATLVNRPAMLANVTTDASAWKQFRPALDGFLQELPAAPVVRTDWIPSALPAYEGLSAPTRVNYVGKGANLYAHGYRLHGSILPILNYLETTWIYEKLRVQGGAYGGGCLFDHLSGTFNYISWRDPNLEGTLQNYDGVPDFLRRTAIDEDELTKSIIGAVGALDTYMLPDAKGLVSLVRYLTGDDDESRQRRRDELLSTTPAHFRALADVLESVRQEGHVVALGSEDGLQTLDRQHGGSWLTLTRAL